MVLWYNAIGAFSYESHSDGNTELCEASNCELGPCMFYARAQTQNCAKDRRYWFSVVGKSQIKSPCQISNL